MTDTPNTPRKTYLVRDDSRDASPWLNSGWDNTGPEFAARAFADALYDRDPKMNGSMTIAVRELVDGVPAFDYQYTIDVVLDLDVFCESRKRIAPPTVLGEVVP